MKLKVFVVRDLAVASFGNPMFMVSAGQATRSFADEVNRKAEGNQLNAHPEDFVLFSLGEYDSETGRFDCGDAVQVSRGVDVYRE